MSVIDQLIEKGVDVVHPASTYVADNVCPDRIAAEVILHPGTRLSGSELSIGPESEIGGETQATVMDCQLGEGVTLKGGFFHGSVFLDGSNMGSGAHVRPGCLLEEEAGGAHCVGLKQTILLPFVTLGSLINFCDCLMAGGTSRKNHSEVGSSFVHFNFTPHNDKATASLFGEVPRGVLLREAPVFLGGQSGVVGPVRFGFGNVLAAGSIMRQGTEEEEGHLIVPAVPEPRSIAYDVKLVRDLATRIRANVRFIGNLWALRMWYTSVRRPIMSKTAYGHVCFEACVRLLDGAVTERTKQLKKLISLATGRDKDHAGAALIARLEAVRPADSAELSAIGTEVATSGLAYTAAVQSLSENSCAVAASVLQGVVDRVQSLVPDQEDLLL